MVWYGYFLESPNVIQNGGQLGVSANKEDLNCFNLFTYLSCKRTVTCHDYSKLEMKWNCFENLKGFKLDIVKLRKDPISCMAEDLIIFSAKKDFHILIGFLKAGKLYCKSNKLQ